MARSRYAEHVKAQGDGRKKGVTDRASYLQMARANAKRGMELPQTKLPPLAVGAIREAARKREQLRREINEKYSNAALAKFWRVHVRTIEKIISYETAAHVP